ncbi:MAG: hypothetical protein AAGI48_03460 [Verrucomicrobiota bacterium]
MGNGFAEITEQTGLKLPNRLTRCRNGFDWTAGEALESSPRSRVEATFNRYMKTTFKLE